MSARLDPQIVAEKGRIYLGILTLMRDRDVRQGTSDEYQCGVAGLAYALLSALESPEGRAAFPAPAQREEWLIRDMLSRLMGERAEERLEAYVGGTD